MSDDRNVHAVSPGGQKELVRYDSAGKWYIETVGGSRTLITINEAANRAVAWLLEGGRVRLYVYGGRAFDAKVRALVGHPEDVREGPACVPLGSAAKETT
jgi:hypothetical protein